MTDTDDRVTLGFYRVVLYRDEDGEWIAEFPDVRGAHTHGRTLRQVRSRLRDVLDLSGSGLQEIVTSWRADRASGCSPTHRGGWGLLRWSAERAEADLQSGGRGSTPLLRALQISAAPEWVQQRTHGRVLHPPLPWPSRTGTLEEATRGP
jgi:predicted RNase H-like HicB family nuclease